MSQPESLSIWDRIFNRYRKEVIKRGEENWTRRKYCPYTGAETSQTPYSRDWVDYKIIDRVTGSETIERKYLN